MKSAFVGIALTVGLLVGCANGPSDEVISSDPSETETAASAATVEPVAATTDAVPDVAASDTDDDPWNSKRIRQLLADGWSSPGGAEGCCDANANGSEAYVEYHPVRRGKKCFARQTLCIKRSCYPGVGLGGTRSGTFFELVKEVTCR